MSSTDTFVANAERYAAGFEAGRLPMPPASHVLVVACMDARLNPYGFWACPRATRTSSATRAGW